MGLFWCTAKLEECPENGQTVYSVLSLLGQAHPLRMELNAPYRKCGVFKRLYRAVGFTAEGNPQAFSQAVYRLVMLAVDDEPLSVDPGEEAFFLRNHRISGSPVGLRCGKVLMEAASEENIQHLMSPADTQNGLSGGDKGPCEGKVIGIPLR